MLARGASSFFDDAGSAFGDASVANDVGGVDAASFFTSPSSGESASLQASGHPGDDTTDAFAFEESAFGQGSGVTQSFF
eukprot:m.88 g.88  ORF g.88 m.88 type:complete len:79 (-) comp28_c1_seq1:155-391(-)